jgi:GT2 family glycosyltransferase
MERLTVVISTYKREELLARMFDHLDAQTTDAFDVVVSVNRDQEDITEIQRICEGRAVVVQGAESGVSASRNAGWRAAQEPVVLFFGDDMLPAPDVVERHLEHHARHPAPEAGLLGHVIWARELRRTAFMDWLEGGIQFDYGSISGDRASCFHLYACHLSIKREMLERVGGYDESFRFGYEDLDLGLRLDQLGFELFYDRDAEVEHLHPPTIEAWRERMRIVAGAERQFVEKHPSFEPYFYKLFTRADELPQARSRGARLAGIVPRTAPVIGHRVHFSADRWFTQQLAQPFLAAWREAEPR